ncbi:MAG TPA: hypothetical protein VF820_04650, partial [Patescibacteria group bacterium]
SGNYILPITPHSSITVVVSKMGYKDTEETVSVDTSKKINTQDLVITPKETSILFNFISFLRHLFMF